MFGFWTSGFQTSIVYSRSGVKFLVLFQFNEATDSESQSGLHHLAALLCTVLLSNLDPKSPEFLLNHRPNISSNHSPPFAEFSTNGHETTCPELANQEPSSFPSVSVADDLIRLEVNDDLKGRKFSCNTTSQRLPHGCILVIWFNLSFYRKSAPKTLAGKL